MRLPTRLAKQYRHWTVRRIRDPLAFALLLDLELLDLQGASRNEDQLGPQLEEFGPLLFQLVNSRAQVSQPPAGDVLPPVSQPQIILGPNAHGGQTNRPQARQQKNRWGQAQVQQQPQQAQQPGRQQQATQPNSAKCQPATTNQQQPQKQATGADPWGKYRFLSNCGRIHGGTQDPLIYQLHPGWSYWRS